MLPQDLFAIVGSTPAETRRLRRVALVTEQRNARPPEVPKADPRTTMAEVPPGTADIRAVPAA